MPDDKPPTPAGSLGEGSESANKGGIAAVTPAAAPTNAVPMGAVSAESMSVPPIPLAAPPPSKAASTLPLPSKKEEPKDSFRELIETIVFVVVLVLMLKTFLAEAFVIPTGSMATTLLGYHHKVTCEKCGYPNLINASNEADPQDRQKQDVVNCRCENCGAWNRR